MSLENCLLPGKPIRLLITLEWIGPAQRVCIREGRVGKRWVYEFVFCLSFIGSSCSSINGESDVNTTIRLAFVITSDYYLSSSCRGEGIWLSTALMPL